MAFTFKLEREDGTPADPPTVKSAVLVWRPGDTIPFGLSGRFECFAFVTMTLTKPLC